MSASPSCGTPDVGRSIPVPSGTGVVRARWMGRVGYAEALRLQEALVGDRQQRLGSDTLLLLEHPPVVTLGRGADVSNLLAGEDRLRSRGIGLFDAGRGGDITYHGPGQLVGYPILFLPPDRRDLHQLLRDIEQVLILTAGEFGVKAERIEGLTGIWVGNEKLAAIGMRVSRWVTSHGFALNVTTDLSGFDLIVPCGIRNRGVTSLQRLLGRSVPLLEVAEAAARSFGLVFQTRVQMEVGRESPDAGR